MEQFQLKPGSSLGIIAGGGQLPLLIAEAAGRLGYRVVAVAHKGETDRQIDKCCSEVKWLRLGQLNKLINFFKKRDVESVVFAGTITKTRIFFDIRPDFRALALWNQLEGHLDDRILRAVAGELEKEGLKVLPYTWLLSDLLFPRGILTRRAPSGQEERDIRFGLGLARQIGKLDIGQCLVVKDGTVLAVEAIEGTDETIRRGGRLGGEGSVVVKVYKPGQDIRFDLPATGVKTIETMIESGAKVLAAEAGRSLFFDRDQAVSLADRHGIAIVGVDPADTVQS
jgi:DUF1009 family protein